VPPCVAHLRPGTGSSAPTDHQQQPSEYHQT
jgi:hypothetical protein